jgi:RNA polymerase primary sigma factor
MSALQTQTFAKVDGAFFEEEENTGWKLVPALETAEASAPAVAAAAPEPAQRAEAEAEADGEEAEAAEGGDDRQGFLGMYFRDMSRLAVLRPSEEFERARHIEGLELELWTKLLGFVPAADWMADVVGAAMETPLPDLKRYRKQAALCHKRASVTTRKAFEKQIAQIAERLRAADADRIYLDAAVTAVANLTRALRTPSRYGAPPAFVKARGFAAFAREVAGLAARVKRAKNDFVKANLRLVVAIARRFNHGRMALPDLIQEGNLGLIKAVDRYDYRRGFRFSTYASWWIRHAINRALADKGREVRLPVHMLDAYQKIAKAERELQARNNRPPTTEEIAAATGIELEKLEEMHTHLRDAPVSLDRRISGEDDRTLGDVLAPPDDAPEISDQMIDDETRRAMLSLLADLKPIEADVLRKRFGLVDDEERTLKEIGAQYRLSRERVRQIEVEALGKMRRAMVRRELR